MTLTNEELDQLDAYLMSDATPKETMDLEMLDGFLVALAIGPEGVPEEEWLDEVFGGTTPPDLDPAIRDLILGHAAHVATSFAPAARQKQPEDEPLYLPLVLQEDTGDDSWMDTLGQYWASGFRAGYLLREEEWSDAMADNDELTDAICNIMTLELGHHPEHPEKTLNRRTREDRVDELPWIIEGVLYSWLERKYGKVETVVREGEKVGRNDPCACGSGKKSKKCCGA
ncbi:uncharacterized protein SAMN05660284_01291 [Formivibrio citricus]|uniref:YecA family protein n=1 Tax=Formivibrio citricus TaxID=83765 RepID=A0A1I4YC86_9NEIS|nr:UPF0149 family protein [Formivibrio citricus]SFN35179.1 uncharacterized protein SAMN05660284_01291 [Formivibrio citricus]